MFDERAIFRSGFAARVDAVSVRTKPAVGSALVRFARGLLLVLMVVAAGLAQSRAAAADEVPVAFIRTLGAQALSVIRSDTPPDEKAAYFRDMLDLFLEFFGSAGLGDLRSSSRS
jgi:hypothetical protein